ncbi:hypothetical protein K439DRAFT_819800 [Ramaria rubella]|nr:hypothetical protein K439DRAFT_819800 [Ramaria rubella]
MVGRLVAVRFESKPNYNSTIVFHRSHVSSLYFFKLQVLRTTLYLIYGAENLLQCCEITKVRSQTSSVHIFIPHTLPKPAQQHHFAVVPPPTPEQPPNATQQPADPKKRHVCSTCARAFTTSGHLAHHIRVHTGECNHKCPRRLRDPLFPDSLQEQLAPHHLLACPLQRQNQAFPVLHPLHTPTESDSPPSHCQRLFIQRGLAGELR